MPIRMSLRRPFIGAQRRKELLKIQQLRAQKVVAGLGWRPGFAPGPVKTGLTVVRPADLLVLTFDRIGLDLEEIDGLTMLVAAGSAASFLVVEFPPQNFGEIAYFEVAEDYPVEPATDPAAGTGEETPDPPPIWSVVGRPSRLVFKVPHDRLPIRWATEDLLVAMGELELSVPDNALPRPGPFLTLTPFFPGILRPMIDPAVVMEVAPNLRLKTMQLTALSRARRKMRTIETHLGLSTRSGLVTQDAFPTLIPDIGRLPFLALPPIPREPRDDETAIEAPYRVIVSPSHKAGWAHRTSAFASTETGKTELWHTRLGRQVGGSVAEGPHPQNLLRAVWTYGSSTPGEPVTPLPGEVVEAPDHANSPFRMSLDNFDRHNVVHLSSNFRLKVGDTDKDFEPEPLDVDRFMLSSLGAWIDTVGSWGTETPTGLAVEEWRHRGTLGRDHYVRVVYAGFLFPFGHRASVVKITERKFHPTEDNRPAYLRQRMFLVVREPLKTYRTSGLVDSDLGSFDLKMPFEAVRVTTRVSPNLDDPKDHEALPGKAQSCFWPYVHGSPFRFAIVATDVDGNRVDMSVPMIFIGKDITDLPYSEDVIGEVENHYNNDALERPIITTGGQKIAFAESTAPDDTALDTQSLTWGVAVPKAEKHDSLDQTKPRFWPVVSQVEANVRSMQVLAGTTDASLLEFSPIYLKNGFAGDNPGEVFLQASDSASAIEVPFSNKSDRSGGFVTPDLQLSGLSRIAGPISGSVETAATATFEPSEYFGALDGARLFGLFALSDVLETAGFDAPEKIPRFTGQNLNEIERLLTDLGQLAQDLVSAGGSHPLTATIDQLTDPVTGSIAALADGGSLATVTSQLTTLEGQLGDLGGSLTDLVSGAGNQAVISQRLSAIGPVVSTLVGDVGLLESFALGDILPAALNARLEWRPELQAYPPNTNEPIFEPGPMVLAVEAAAQVDGGSAERFVVTASLDDFKLNLQVLCIEFEKLQFRVSDGKKPEIDVVFKDETGLAFLGILKFIETLKELIPGDGFSDPPDVEVTPEGITAGFTVGLPNISVGVFSLENLSLGAGFNIPFIGESLSIWFNFCERENPALLSVSMFGGGFYLGLTINPEGLKIFEAALEFGANISIDLGVASGGVSAMAGIYFKIEDEDFTLAGYFRMRGELDVLGIVSISLELYLELRYESASGKCIGTASITVEVQVLVFSGSVTIKATKKFAGSGPDPTFAQIMGVTPEATSPAWEEYCAAFA